MESDINPDSSVVHSEIIPKKPKYNDMSYSVNTHTNCESFMYESDEYKIISRSAPNQMAKSYLENYIKEKNKQVTGQAIPILGNEPTQSQSVVNSIISKSVKTVRSYFSGW